MAGALIAWTVGYWLQLDFSNFKIFNIQIKF